MLRLRNAAIGNSSFIASVRKLKNNSWKKKVPGKPFPRKLHGCIHEVDTRTSEGVIVVGIDDWCLVANLTDLQKVKQDQSF